MKQEEVNQIEVYLSRKASMKSANDAMLMAALAFEMSADMADGLERKRNPKGKHTVPDKVIKAKRRNQNKGRKANRRKK